MLSVLPSEKLKRSIEEFTIKGVGRESLSSWKEAASVIMLVMSVVIGGACAGKQLDPAWIVHGEQKFGSCDIAEVKDGWCDEHTFRIHAAGVSWKKITDPDEKKKRARRGAILNAQYQILEKFKGAKIEGATGIMETDYAGIALAKEITGHIKAGKVIAEIYDEEQNCEIVYEVHATDLKKKILEAEWHWE